MTASPEHAFVPHDIDASEWSQLKPLYEAIIDRAKADFPNSRLGIKGARLDIHGPGQTEWTYPG